MKVVIDIEANAVKAPTKIWCIVCREITDEGETKAITVFSDTVSSCRPLSDFARYSNEVDYFIGHNIIHYDLRVIDELLGVRVDYRKCIDTLVLSRLLDYSRQGGHSLDALSGGLKKEFNHWLNFDKYFEEGLDYCINDTYINLLVYLKYIPYLNSSKWIPSIQLEHFIQYISLVMNLNGFKFKIKEAKELHSIITTLRDKIDYELKDLFPLRVIPIREVTPTATKFGSINLKDFRFLKNLDLSPYAVGDAFTIIRYEPPNMSSNQQMIDVLNAAGWKPVDKTEGHKKALQDKLPKEKLDYFKKYGWKVNETNLETLPKDAPAGAKKLAERILLSSRLGDLEEWFKAYREDTGRIHGSYLGIGSWTHRMAHREPNTANIVGVKTRSGEVAFLGKELRQLWTCSENTFLIGTDAKSVQLRILAHYMNDPEFIHAVCSGTKENGDDPHSLNARALGPICKSREPAKTFS